jgi:tetratricopeptide (TPR) repeat protein
MSPFEQNSRPANPAEAKRALMESGDAFYDAGEMAKALDCYHRASLLDKDDPAVWCALGMSYYGLEFNREAWRSYMFALNCAPEDPDTLWYAAEFLAGVGDKPLAAALLRRYQTVEKDAERLAGGAELLDELGVPEPAAAPDDEAVEESPEAPESASEFDDAEAELEPDEADDYNEDQAGAFVAPLSLQLEGIGANCRHCAAAMPVDAPYCYACLMPHFYEEV